MVYVLVYILVIVYETRVEGSLFFVSRHLRSISEHVCEIDVPYEQDATIL